MSASAAKLERRIAHASFPLSQTPYSSPVTPFQMPASLSPRRYPTMSLAGYGAPSSPGSPYRQMSFQPAPLNPSQYPPIPLAGPGAPSSPGSPYRQMSLPPAPYRQSPTLSPRFPQRPMSLPAPRPPSPRLQGRLSAPAPLQRRFGYDGHCTR